MNKKNNRRKRKPLLGPLTMASSMTVSPKGNPSSHLNRPLQLSQSLRPYSCSNDTSNPAVQTLNSLLKQGIEFIPATHRTIEDEEAMAPTLRPRSNSYANENADQRLKRVAVWELALTKWFSTNMYEQTHHISSNWQKQRFRASPSRGLHNRSVDCYRNSLFQALVHMPKVVNYFEMHHKYCQRDDCVACAFKNFTEDYWNDPTDNKVYKALSLLQTNMANSRKFRNVQWTWSRQNDSMEFLLTLLKTLRGKVHPTARPIMKELFSFQMAESLYCPNRSCKAVSSQNSIHNSLTIDLNNPRPLKDMIHAYFARDTRPGWRCSHCNQYVGAQDRVQGVRMHTSPNILVIDLKRFTPIGHTGHMIKNNAHIPLKQELDLTPYTVNNHPSRYQLQSVVHHAGSLTGGHYIAVCKGPGDDWRQLNDQTVTVTDARSAMNRKDGFTPYILFYVRRGGRACASLLDDVNIHLV